MQNTPDQAGPPAYGRVILYLSYLFGWVLCCLVLLLSIGGTDWFLNHCDYSALRMIDYGPSLKNADCQIVIYGDSGAMTGGDARTIEERTHRKTCNLSMMYPIRIAAGTIPLDQYLENNQRPQIIVFLFASGSYRPTSAWNMNQPEGTFYFLRHQKMRAPMFLVEHPLQIFRYISWEYESVSAFYSGSTATSQSYGDTLGERIRRQGTFTYPLPAQTTCSPPKTPFKKPDVTDLEYVRELREKYGRDGTRVIVDVEPMNECLSDVEDPNHPLTGLHDNQLDLVPTSFFNSESQHFTKEGAIFISEKLAQQINAVP